MMKKTVLAFLFMATGFFAIAKSGYMLRSNNGSLKKQTARGMEYAVQIPFGAKVEILSDTPVSAFYYWTGGRSNSAMDFYKVSYQSEEYFIAAKECAIGENPIVITEDATLFTKDQVSSFRNAYLPRGTICLKTGKSSQKGGVSFSQVTFYDSADSTLKTRWVQSKKISSDANDVKAAQLVELAFVQTDKGMKENFMKLAMNIETTSKIKNYVEAVNKKMKNIIDGSNTESYTRANAVVLTDDGSMVNLRAAPQKGAVITKLPSETHIATLYRTVETEKIEGLTEHWYYIQTESASGWLFGGYIAFLGDVEDETAE
ncbi:hypothetical protein [Treponema zioleckii]|uniref:hypothetical protein n=1 Tax=Treponema zioleckii TaxID=331680 RepID=UPI00168A7AB0|nr:hypothetical protein [Treponema zioleckii]